MPLNQIGYGLGLKKPIPLTLNGGSTYVLPAGQYMIDCGPYTYVQWYDPVSGIWRIDQTSYNANFQVISSDGYNWRLANLTGCMIGAYLTNGGTGYPNGIYPAGTPLAG